MRLFSEKTCAGDVSRSILVGEPTSTTRSSFPKPNLIEVFGDLAPGDQIAVRGTDELRSGTRVNVKQPQGQTQGGK
jgi:hypothetical protein